MTVPYYVNEHQSDVRAIKPGWYGLERNGKLSSGPFLNQGKCLTGISRDGASPWWQPLQKDLPPSGSRVALAADPANGRATS